jgi:PKD repeat protein
MEILRATSNECFKVTNGPMTAGVHYTISGLPEGLTAVVTGKSSSKAEISLNGHAVYHDSGNSGIIGITFLNAAFSGGNAGAIKNTTNALVKIAFFDPYKVVYKNEVYYLDPLCNSSNEWVPFEVGSATFGVVWWDWGQPLGIELHLDTFTDGAITYPGTPLVMPLTLGNKINVDGSGTGSYYYNESGYQDDNPDFVCKGFTEWIGKTAYVGFNHQNKYFGFEQYGWIKMQVINNVSMKVVEWAWNTRPNSSIKAGMLTTPGLVADFKCCLGLSNNSFVFDNSSSSDESTILQWNWTTGDGFTFKQKNLSYNYETPGIYLVTLTVTDNQNKISTKKQAVKIPYLVKYCPATNGYDYSYISNVTVGSINKTSTWGANGYSDYSSTKTTMNVGSSYPIKVTSDYSNSDTHFGVWIDWNNDGQFDGTNETIKLYTGNSPLNTTITPPAGTYNGEKRLRIRYNMVEEMVSPCGYDYYIGETEDYTIVVTGGLTIPSAQFTYTTNNATVSVTDQSTGGTITGWLWDFGDGSNSTLKNPPPHTYTQSATYPVTLTVTNNSNTSNAIGKKITVNNGNTNFEYIIGVFPGTGYDPYGRC